MSLLMIGIVVWLSLAVLVCCMGRAAKLGDSVGLGHGLPEPSSGGVADSQESLPETRGPRLQPVASASPEDWLRRELTDARRALSNAEARIAQLEGRRRAGVA